MNTTKSEELVQKFFREESKYKRFQQKITKTVNESVEKVFPLLCPSREADWIPGWTAHLVYTSTGYAEENCVFKTDKSCSSGEGIWIFTGFERNKFIEYVRFQQDILSHVKVETIQNKDETTTLSWNVVQTALSDNGNMIIEKKKKSQGKDNLIFEMMIHYLKTGESISSHSEIQLLISKLHEYGH